MTKRVKEGDIERLKQQVAMLTQKIDLLERKSSNLCTRFEDVMIDADMDPKFAATLASEIVGVLQDWVNNQRTKITQVIMETSEMPPYSNCLNDLLKELSLDATSFNDFSLTPTSSVQTRPMGRTTPPSLADPVPQSEDQSLHYKPKLQRFNIPKPIPGAVPLPLPLSPGEEE
jgi:hypothetical protein